MKKDTARHCKTLQKTLVAVSLSFAFALPVHAQLDKSTGIYKTSIVSNSSLSATLKAKLKDSYLVMFKDPTKDGEQHFIKTFKEMDAGEDAVATATATATASITASASGTWNEKQDIVDQLHLDGEIIDIYRALNGIHVKMSEAEASRLSRDERVSSVTEDGVSTVASDPSWGLDRMDDQVPNIDGTYSTNNTGAGQTIYILDTGINLDEPRVAAEFGGRATMFWDVNQQGGRDGNGHGSMVASAAAGKTYGVAKGAKLIIAKITDNNTGGARHTTSTLAFNWLADNAPAGSIVNWSHGYANFRLDGNGDRILDGNGNPITFCGPGVIVPPLEIAIKRAHAAGIIVVVAAGNDGCNTARYTPTRMPEVFVVGATSRLGFPNSDRKVAFSRTGQNISAFAPGQSLLLMGRDGDPVVNHGTSFSAPYIAGAFILVK